MTWSSLMFEATIPFLLFNRRLRRLGFAFGLLLHGGIALTSVAGMFSLCMVPYYAAFLQAEDLDALQSLGAAPGRGAFRSGPFRRAPRAVIVAAAKRSRVAGAARDEETPMTMDRARQPSRREFLGGVALASQGLLDEACAVGGGAAYPPLVRQTLPGGLEVRGPRLYRDGRPFFVAGMNHWAAPTLARDRVGWDRVRHDFDVLQGLGVNAIRLMGSTEGPDSEPFRIVPSMQPSEGQFDEAGVAGLFRVVEELEKRRMVGIVVLTNFWQWSGGMAQYVAWAGGGPIPYPTPDRGGDWGRFKILQRASTRPPPRAKPSAPSCVVWSRRCTAMRPLSGSSPTSPAA